MDLGLPQLSISMAKMETMQSLSINMIRRGIDQVEQTGEQLVQMMQAMQVAQMPQGSSGSTINVLA